MRDVFAKRSQMDDMLGKDKARFEGEIATVEERWLSLSAQLEDAQRA